MYCCRTSTKALETRWMILSRLLKVTSNLSDTDLITSVFEINHTKADTCLFKGTGVLPKACCCGILPMAQITLHKLSIVPLVILKRLRNSSNEYSGTIFSQNSPLLFRLRGIKGAIAENKFIPSAFSPIILNSSSSKISSRNSTCAAILKTYLLLTRLWAWGEYHCDW